MSNSVGDSTSKDNNDNSVRFKQRALVLQGGGALGAYEAGAFRAFYDWLSMQTADDENIFDVIAGTSIGAITASLITNEVIQSKRKADRNGNKISQKACWEGVPDILEDFWLNKVGVSPFSSPFIETFWQQFPLNQWLPNIASKEAARKYFAAKESVFFGSKGVFSPASPFYDTKYFDFFNTWYRSGNQRLKETLANCISFPIKTAPSENDPRLLTVSTDVVTGQAVVFDSYETAETDQDGNIKKDDNGRLLRSNHTTFTDSRYANQGKETVTIRYDNGLSVEHILSSASVPINFDYQWIPLQYDYENPSNNHPSNLTDGRYRPFWDGGIMSNTPLEELLEAHRAFWTDEIGTKILRDNIWKIPTKIKHGPLSHKGLSFVPNLDVYMINVWPKDIDRRYVPTDYDLTQARQNNITFGDKTQKDQLESELISDYTSMIKEIRNVALESAKDEKTKQKLNETLEQILKEPTNVNRTDETRSIYATNEDLMLGVASVDKVIRVERGADRDAIFNMMLDFSTQTIKIMIEKGRQDALLQIISHVTELVSRSRQQEKQEKLLSLLKEAESIIELNPSISAYRDAIQKLHEFVTERDTQSRMIRVASQGKENIGIANITRASSLLQY